MSDDTSTTYNFRTRGESLRATKQRKLDELFRDRKWEIVKEFCHPRAAPGEDQDKDETVLGQWVRRGYVIRDIATDEQIVVGNDLLKIIARRYQGVTLPVRRRGRPPKNRTVTPA